MTSNNISVYMGKGGMKKVNVRRVRALARVDRVEMSETP